MEVFLSVHVTPSPKVPVFCSKLAYPGQSAFRKLDTNQSQVLKKDQASLEQKTGTFGDSVPWPQTQKPKTKEPWADTNILLEQDNYEEYLNHTLGLTLSTPSLFFYSLSCYNII